MPWTKGKIEKAWRVFDKSMVVIADALEVDVLELKALILDGTLPIYDRTPAEEIRNMEAAGVDIAAVMAERQVDTSLAPDPTWYDETPPAPTPEIVEHLTKRATLADLAPPAPEVVLEAAAPIVEKPLEFRKPAPKVVKASQISTSSDREGPGYQEPAIDMLIGDKQGQPDQRSRRNNTASHPKPKMPTPGLFFLMLDGKYLHESCTGLTTDKAHAWRQPEGKIAAVRRKFPETVDYLEVPAS